MHSPCLFSITKLVIDSNKNLEHLFGGWKTYQTCFSVHPQCRTRTVLGGSRWKACFCANPQCRSSAYVGGVYLILILKAWQTSHKGQQSLTKLNVKQAAYMSGSFASLNIMFGSGRNSSFVIQELIIWHFYVFQKINLQNFTIAWSKRNSSSDLLISYPSIT